MCLLVFMPEGKTASKLSLERASYYNDDGFGWAIRTPNQILVGKHMDFDKAYEEFTAARSSYNGDALFHLRITTQGKTDLENCHPFYVGKDQLSVVAHNGMLDVTDDKSGRSDTRIFAESLLPQRGGISFLNGEHNISKLEKWAAGSKLVFLTANPASKWRYVILNMSDGHWGKDEDDGVWFSNSSYKYTPAPRSYVGGWDYGWSSGGVATYYNPATQTEGTTGACMTTDEAIREELWFELQNHAYEIAESLLERQYRQMDKEDPEVLENSYYNVAEELLDRFNHIYKPYAYHTYRAECQRCGGEMFLDYLDLPATHCAHCDCCLYCGSEVTEGCQPEDCCAWPMGYAMSYHPSQVQREMIGGKDAETAPTI